MTQDNDKHVLKVVLKADTFAKLQALAADEGGQALASVARRLIAAGVSAAAPMAARRGGE